MPDDAKAHYNQALEIADTLSMAPLRARCLERLIVIGGDHG